MTHDELLAKIDYYLQPTIKMTGDDRIKNSAIGFMRALRAVVELHKPSRIDKDMTYCEGCSNSAFFPWKSCPTIQAIEKELA